MYRHIWLAPQSCTINIAGTLSPDFDSLPGTHILIEKKSSSRSDSLERSATWSEK